MTKPKKRAYSGRGGERENAGRPNKWNNTPTTAIRVPEVLVNQIMVYAHKLDDGTVQNQTDVSEKLLKLITDWQAKIKDKELQPRWNNVSKLLTELQSLLHQE